VIPSDIIELKTKAVCGFRDGNFIVLQSNLFWWWKLRKLNLIELTLMECLGGAERILLSNSINQKFFRVFLCGSLFFGWNSREAIDD
jgi:hypothetical protein